MASVAVGSCWARRVAQHIYQREPVLTLRSRYIAVTFALCTGLVVACSSDATPSSGTPAASSGSAGTNEPGSGGAPGGTSSSAAGAQNNAGGAPAAGGTGSAPKTGIVKLSLKAR